MKLADLRDYFQSGRLFQGDLNGLLLGLVGSYHDLRRLSLGVGLFLDDRGDAYLVPAEDVGDLGEDAGTVGNSHSHVVAGARDPPWV